MNAPSGHEKILEVKSLNLILQNGLKKVHLLHDISFEIAQGQSLALLGPSGSGKSLTVLSLLDLLPAYLKKSISGEATFYKNDIQYSLLNLDQKSWTSIRGKHIAMIFQDPVNALNPIKRCGNQILESVLLHKQLDRKNGILSVKTLLERVGFEDSGRIFQAYPHELSGGQLQRVLIAMALAGGPDLLVADEPTTNLDANSKEEILRLLEKLQKEDKISLLYITHDHEEARRMTDEIIYLREGRVVDASANMGQNDQRIVIDKTNGNSKTRSVLLEIRSLTKTYPQSGGLLFKHDRDLSVFSELNFEIFKRHITGVVGASGSGKTTLGRVLLKLEEADRGRVLYQGENILNFEGKQERKLREKLQIVYQNPYNTLNPRMKIIDIVKEPLKVHKIGKNTRERTEKAAEILKRVGIEPAKHLHYMYQLSGGQRQRVAIARALVLQPEFVVLDECVSSLDRQTQVRILELLLGLKDDFGLSYLFISHDMETVQAISDEIYELEKGKLKLVEHD